MIRFEKVSFEQFKEDLNNLISDGKLHISLDKPIEEVYNDIRLPERGTAKSAGYDFFSPVDVFLEGPTVGTVMYADESPTRLFLINHYQVIPTGIRFVTDRDDIVLLCAPRSGQGFKNGLSLANTTGVIDADYCGSSNEGHIFAKISVYKDLQIDSGKAFMQGIIVPFIKTDNDNATAVRDGGFDSTGK